NPVPKWAQRVVTYHGSGRSVSAEGNRGLPWYQRAVAHSVLAEPQGGLLPAILGPLREHPLAGAFSREVARGHLPYATEVVAAFGLCPFVKDPESAFGAFAVMLDVSLDAETVLAFVERAATSVSHVVFPLTRPAPFVFERFSNDLGERLRERYRERPVLA